MSQHSISVVIPAFEAARTLRRAVDSVFSQHDGGFELQVVIVDDGSTDQTLQVAKELAQDDERVIALTQANAGPSAARNHGINAARGHWLLFLDADDTLCRGAFEAWKAGVERHPDGRWLHSGWVRTFGDAAPIEHSALDLPDPVQTLPQSCPFAIHACLIERAAVNRIGGFDEAIHICEDWDLWRRLANDGVRPIAIPGLVAEYLIRTGSSSASSRRMLADAMVVIDKTDPAAFTDTEVTAFRANYMAYVAGSSIARNEDPTWVTDGFEPRFALDLDPQAIASFLFFGVPMGLVRAIDAWPTYPSHVFARTRAFLEHFEQATGTRGLAQRTLRRIEALIADSAARSEGPVQYFDATLLDIDLAGGVPSDVGSDGAGVVVHARAWVGSRRVSRAELPLWTPEIIGADVLDALLEADAWSPLEALILEPLLPQLSVWPTAEGTGRVMRGTIELGTTPTPLPSDRELLDAAGWSLFLQEAFGGATFDPARIFGRRGTLRSPLRVARSRRRVDFASVPTLLVRGDRVFIDVDLGGIPIDGFELAPHRGMVTAGRIRAQLLLRNARDLPRLLLRSWLHDPARDAQQLRASLLRPSPFAGDRKTWTVARAANQAPVSARHIRRSVTGPPAETIAAAASALGMPVLGQRRGRTLHRSAQVGPLASAPAAPPAPDAQGIPESSLRESATSFETFFASADDPWDYTSPYEQHKYDQTLSLFPERVDRVLEVACAEGHFTHQLAKRAGHVHATDVSTLALERAAERCAHVSNVSFAQHDLFDDPVEGEWDAIVCSEVLYYAGDHSDLRRVLDRLVSALKPGGVLVTAHANLVVDDPTAPGFDWDEEYGSVGIEAALLATGKVALEKQIVTPMYRVQRYRRASSRISLGRKPRVETLYQEPAGEIADDVLRHFLPAGGTPTRSAQRAVTGPPILEVPILMYHRVAPDGAASLRRYRVTPEEFAEQVAFIKRAGFETITSAQWRDAVTLGRPLPERPIILTFDDGFADFAEHAAPTLSEAGLDATVLLVTSLVGRTSEWDADREAQPLMGWSEIRGLSGSGVEFGAHTRSHPALTGLRPSEVLDEIAGSAREVATQLGAGCTAFAYPFGDVTPSVREALALTGVDVGFTCEARVATSKDDLLMLPRIEVRGDRPFREVIAQLTSW